MPAKKPTLYCDRDQTARALVVANLPGTYFEVHLCGHHARRYLPKLRAEGWDILVDAREDGVNAWTGVPE